MKFLRKTAAVLTAAAVICSCGSAFAAPKEIPYSERVFELTDEKTAEVNLAINSFEAALEKENNWDGVMEEYNKLLALYMEIGAVNSLANTEVIKLNCQMDSAYTLDEASASADAASRLSKDIRLAVKLALSSAYANQFKEYWGEWRTAGIENITDTYDSTRVDFSKRYYEIINDTNASVSEKSKQASALLVEIAEYGNKVAKEQYGLDSYIDRVYDGTGYGTEDVARFVNMMQQYSTYVNKFRNYLSREVVTETIMESFSPEEIEKNLAFVSKISPEMDEAYRHMMENGLFFASANGNQQGQTAYYPFYGDGAIIVSGTTSMHAAIHEFGHYFSSVTEDVGPEEFFASNNGELAEFDSQIFELLALDYYGDIYGVDAEKYIVQNLLGVLDSAIYSSTAAMAELMIYLAGWDADALRVAMEQSYGSEWYLNNQFFTYVGNSIRYSLALVDVLQVFDLYLKDKNVGYEKYYEIMSTDESTDETYTELNERYGLVSAFDENAYEVITEATSNIFEHYFGINYDTALDYFENKTYLGNVFPTSQKVSVNGNAPVTLYAYNSNGFNYIRIRDLAALLAGTSAEFGVDWDEKTFTVNILSGGKYDSTGTEMTAIPSVETAGMKASGTAHLTLDGQETGYAKAIFVNGWNCYQLRGLSENNILPIDVDYDTETNTVLIATQ